MNIYIATPTSDHKLEIEIGMRWLQLVQDNPHHQFEVDTICSSFICMNRNRLVLNFLRSSCDYLLFWDNDVIPDSTRFIDQLLETGKKLNAKIVAAVYLKKQPSLREYCTSQYDESKENVIERFINYSEIKEPQIVDCTGTGLMLIKREVLEKISLPWFEVKEYGAATFSEDFNFCLQAKKAGFLTAVDPRIPTRHAGGSFWTHKL